MGDGGKEGEAAQPERRVGGYWGFPTNGRESPTAVGGERADACRTLLADSREEGMASGRGCVRRERVPCLDWLPFLIRRQNILLC